MPRMWNFFILSKMNHLIVILGLLFLCMGNMQADEPVKTGFTHMERSHVRVHTPGLFSKGNSVEIHRYIWSVWLIRSSASRFPEERSFLLMEAVVDIREQI